MRIPLKYPRFFLAGFAVILSGIAAAWAFSTTDREGAARRAERVDFRPVRGEMRELSLRRTGFVYHCNECHYAFQSPPGRRDLVGEHTELRLEHGRNDYCLSCHHPANRESYTALDGSEIPADNPALLCAQCHGPTYRDWETGVHGRSSGYWDPEKGPQERLFCIQCHDPHAPAFPALAPMPGPEIPVQARR